MYQRLQLTNNNLEINSVIHQRLVHGDLQVASKKDELTSIVCCHQSFDDDLQVASKR
jgi:hypothetical protein